LSRLNPFERLPLKLQPPALRQRFEIRATALERLETKGDANELPRSKLQGIIRIEKAKK
jgi:hypothetical protein